MRIGCRLRQLAVAGLSFCAAHIACAQQLYVEPDCPAPADAVSLVAYKSDGPLLRPQPLSVSTSGSTFKVVGVLNPIANPLPPARPLKIAVGPLPVGSYTFEFFTREEGPGGVLGPEVAAGSKMFSVSTNPPPCSPVLLTVVQGSNGTTTINASFDEPVVVAAYDAQGRGVPGAPLAVTRLSPPAEYAAGQPEGTIVHLSSTELTTGADGTATVAATAGMVPGAIQYQVTWIQGDKSLATYVNFGVLESAPTAAVIPVIEYLEPQAGSYFVTSSLAEQAKLDRGEIPGWQRTGGAWLAFAQSDPVVAVPRAPVCRFFGPGWHFVHFFSVFTTECDGLRHDAAWIEESPAIFGMVPPTAHGCPPGTAPIFRTVRFASPFGHRFTDSMKLSAYEVANGAVAEGLENPPVSMCGPH